MANNARKHTCEATRCRQRGIWNERVGGWYCGRHQMIMLRKWIISRQKQRARHAQTATIVDARFRRGTLDLTFGLANGTTHTQRYTTIPAPLRWLSLESLIDAVVSVTVKRG